MKKKIILMSMLFSLILGMFNTTIHALELNEIETIDLISTNSLEVAEEISSYMEYGNVVARNTLLFGKQVIDLYVEFENETVALNNFIKDNVDVLSYLKETYELDNITSSNFNEYYSKFKSSLENNPWYNSDEIIYKFDSFMDIFENKEKNDEIINVVNSMSKRQRALLNENEYNYDMLNLTILLPSYSNLSTKGNDFLLKQKSNEISTRALSETNLTNAINYAKLNATSPNVTNYKYYADADCTNFASQILEAGGKSQIVTSSESTGWWHIKTVVSDRVTTHDHSLSWIRADKFAKYMGIFSNHTTITSLAKNVKAGDFIAKDSSKDGDYDHIGFVTLKDSSLQLYEDEDGNVRSYINFKVAQHTSNYHRWVSDDGNDWEKMSTKNFSVSIVAR